MPWRGLLLGASLVLNLLLIGFIIGDLSRPIRTISGLREFAAHYPEEIRLDLRRNIFGERRALLADLRELNDHRSALFKAMRAEDADIAAIKTEQAEVRRLTSALQERLQSATIDAVLAHPAAVRKRIGEPRLSDTALDLETD